MHAGNWFAYSSAATAVAAALFFEWLSLKTGYLVYKGWSLYYSLVVYVIGLLFLRWHLRFIRQ